MPGVMTHACSVSCSGGRGRRIVAGSFEFNPPYHKDIYKEKKKMERRKKERKREKEYFPESYRISEWIVNGFITH
jgi:hypothetical protein